MIPDPLPHLPALVLSTGISSSLCIGMQGAALGCHCWTGWLQVGAAAFKLVWGNPGLGDEVTECFGVRETDLAVSRQQRVPLGPPRTDPVSKVTAVRRGWLCASWREGNSAQLI